MRRVRFDGRILFTLLAATLAALLLYEAAGLSPAARLAPLAVLLPTLALLLIQLVLDMAPGEAGALARLGKADVFGVRRIREWAGRRRAGETADGDIRRRMEVAVMLWVALLPVSIYLAGLLLALPAYTLLYLRLRSGESWRLSLAVAAVIFIVLYGVFVIALRVPLYGGLLPGSGEW